MPVSLDRPAKDVDITAAEYGPLLANLQANVLRAHGRDFARHVFLRFTAGGDDVRAWLRGLQVTSAAEQLDQIERRRADPGFSGGLVTGLYLSALGYEHLGLDTERFASEAFRKGMKDRGGLVEGVVETVLDTGNKDPEPDRWEAGFRDEIHAMVALADDDERAVAEAADALRATAGGVADVLTVEEGTVLRRRNSAGDLEPIEHFGYFDGISNPLFTQQDLDAERPENQAREHWDAGARLSLVLADDPFTAEPEAYGSYLVYRKLGQDVARFNARVTTLAGALATNEPLAGAMAVGRFKDGTPVVRESAPDPGPEVVNDFDFEEDPHGTRCPAHAHIRKVNPRGTTPLTSLESERRRRVVRRGIPYGPPFDAGADARRGLLFMCFQRNVEEQFEFIQRTWVDNEHFPTGIPTLGLLQRDTGDDPVIGQDPDEAQRWPKAWGDRHAGKKAFNFESAVTLEGGEYLFAPSLPFLRSL
jgi:Dyp-type peroxidase family